MNELRSSLVKKGLYQTKADLNLQVDELLTTCFKAIALGQMSKLDLYFSWPSEVREVMQRSNTNGIQITSVTPLEMIAFVNLRQTSSFQADFYLFLSTIERRLHEWVRSQLVRGSKESNEWWGLVPTGVRIDCARIHEEELSDVSIVQYPDDLYRFTRLLDLHKIIDSNIQMFEKLIEPNEIKIPKDLLGHRKKLKEFFVALNNLRNEIMHPVKHRLLREDDYRFLINICDDFQIDPFRASTS